MGTSSCPCAFAQTRNPPFFERTVSFSFFCVRCGNFAPLREKESLEFPNRRQVRKKRCLFRIGLLIRTYVRQKSGSCGKKIRICGKTRLIFYRVCGMMEISGAKMADGVPLLSSFSLFPAFLTFPIGQRSANQPAIHSEDRRSRSSENDQT